MKRKIPDALTPGEAWERLKRAPLMPVETRPISDSIGHCLAEPAVASEDVPSGDRSFMDGYAVRASDVASVPARIRIAGEVLMGQPPAVVLSPGECAAIPTGGFLPAGADAVVMQEDTEIFDDTLAVHRAVHPGENIQLRGEDFKTGDTLFHAGHRLRPQDLSTLATFGIQAVSVHRKPRIHILSTGNELVPFSAASKTREQIRESNSLALASACGLFGFPHTIGGIVVDDFASQKVAVESAMQTADVILMSGGSSVGERDFAMDVIQSFPRHAIHFHGIAIRPGNPTIFASAGSSWIFGVPGQPVSSLIVFYLYVLPFLVHLSGEQVDHALFPHLYFKTVRAHLTREVQPLKSKTDYLRVKLAAEGPRWRAIPVIGKSASLSTLSRADGFAIIAPGEQPVAEGALVDVFLFP